MECNYSNSLCPCLFILISLWVLGLFIIQYIFLLYFCLIMFDGMLDIIILPSWMLDIYLFHKIISELFFLGHS